MYPVRRPAFRATRLPVDSIQEDLRFMNTQLSPARILETATAFWPSKVLLSAIELGVFTQLAQGPMTGTQLSEAVGIRRDRSADFFDSLVALSFLERKGAGQDAVYE